MTPNEFRLKVLCHAATSYSMAHPTDPTARHVERAGQLADECLREATRLGMFGQFEQVAMPQSAVSQPEMTQPIMPPPLQGFAQSEAQPAATNEVAPTAPLAPQAAAPQVPMQPLPQSNAPQMQMHSSMQPIPQMPIGAAMQNVAPATQVPMSGVAAGAGAGNVGTPMGGGGVGNGAIPAIVPPQLMPAAPPQVAPMNVPATGASFQPFGPHGPSIPLPPMPQQPQQQQAAPQQAPTHGQPAQQPGTPVQGAPGLFVPPQTMGGTNTVTQAPLPDNFSALGSIGVQEKVEQRPMAQGPIVAPGNQSVVSGGSMPTVVGEKITH